MLLGTTTQLWVAESGQRGSQGHRGCFYPLPAETKERDKCTERANERVAWAGSALSLARSKN